MGYFKFIGLLLIVSCGHGTKAIPDAHVIPDAMPDALPDAHYDAQVDGPVDANLDAKWPDAGCLGTNFLNGHYCSCNTDCLSGFCVQGVCCNTPCNQACETCHIGFALGTCNTIPNCP